jgi:hypothetical protein
LSGINRTGSWDDESNQGGCQFGFCSLNPDIGIMMQRVILENQGIIPRKLSNPGLNIKDLARFCQTEPLAPAMTKSPQPNEIG